MIDFNIPIILAYEFLEKDYTYWGNFVYLFIVFGAITFLRYLFLSKLYIISVYDKVKAINLNRILSDLSSSEQRNKEIMWSGISSILFGIIGVIMIIVWQMGYTQLYTDIHQYPLWYIPLSILGSLFIHETYYYWLHRWLHLPSVYRLIHKTHHDSISTSVWTSFSFHPIESLLQAIIIPVIVLLIPLHIFVLIFLLVLMTLSAIINHAGVEIFPSGANHHWFWRHLIGATHHDQHHRKFVYNYGLYFTFWDKIMKTETEDYDEYFNQKTSK